METLGKVLVTLVIAFNIMALFVWLMFRNKLGGNFPMEPEAPPETDEKGENDTGEDDDGSNSRDR